MAPRCACSSLAEIGSDAVSGLGRDIIWKSCLLSPPRFLGTVSVRREYVVAPCWSVSVKMGSEGPVSSLMLVFLQTNTGAGCREHIGAEPSWEMKSKVLAMEGPNQCGSP